MTYDECLNEMCYGENHLLILAAGGYGKSHLIRKMQEQDIKNVLYLAPTGLAALNINGMTLHSAFNLLPSVNYESKYMITDKGKFQLLKNARTILIDEVSMVRSDAFDATDRLLRSIHGSSEPFGGIRVILVGDIFQLNPVANKADKEYLKGLYPSLKNDFTFFNSNVFNNPSFLSNLKICELTHNFRQQGDTIYSNILHFIRFGFNKDMACAAINQRLGMYPNQNFQMLATTKKIANDYNDNILISLPDHPYLSIPEISPIHMIDDEIVRLSPMASPLFIKNDMQIMFVMNDSMLNGRRWVNGSLATVKEKRFSSSTNLEYVIVELNGQHIEVFRDSVDIFRPVYNPEKKTVEIAKVATICQFPFVASWATTIHRQQGQTIMSKILINLGQSAFAPGQTYVALSRVRTIDDIYLTRPLYPNDILVSESTSLFYQNIAPVLVSVNLE